MFINLALQFVEKQYLIFVENNNKLNQIYYFFSLLIIDFEHATFENSLTAH